jgi:D-glycero-alpha-D-manno-heptose-7-phosphate kinase
MLIASSPLRISLLGGGSDYPEHFSEHGGSVFGFAINSRTYVSALKIDPVLAGHNFKIAYRKVEEVDHLNQIDHLPFRIALENSGIRDGWEFSVGADLPAFTGLGSSSSFLVALLSLLSELKSDSFEKSKIATEAFLFERNSLSQKVGLQDQVFAAYGGVQLIKFDGPMNFQTNLVEKSNLSFIEDNCLILSTGTKRKAAPIVEDIAVNAKKNTAALLELAELADVGYALAIDGKLNAENLGEMLNTSWELKKSLSKLTSNTFLDEQISMLQKAGAKGIKLLGAGGGGFLLIILNPGEKEEFKNKIGESQCRDITITEIGARVQKVGSN